MRICEVGGCNNKYYAKGYCLKHWAQHRRYGKILKRTIQDPNEIVIKADCAEVVLYNIKSKEKARTIIDLADVGKIKHFKWYAIKRQGCLVVGTMSKGALEYMPNIIMNFNSNRFKMIDHRDRNPLNNRRANLRVCNQSQNQMNKKIPKNNTSGYKGVCWVKNRKTWKACIRANGENLYLGSFKDKIDAAQAYNKAAIKHFGEFACLNSI